MGFCVDPCDWYWRINGVSVGPFRGYPMCRRRIRGVRGVPLCSTGESMTIQWVNTHAQQIIIYRSLTREALGGDDEA